jgi:hypothetical protein
MQIIKSKLLRPRKCEFGNFELMPEKGWKLSQTFIDYESGLLIVSVNEENENNWEDLGDGCRRIPTQQFVIDLNQLKILSSDEWSKYFSYNKTTLTSEDEKFKLTTQRIHEPENNTDSIFEELEFLETGRKSSSTGVAFSIEKRENSLERMYRQIRERDEQRRILDAKPTLEEFCSAELKKLNSNEVIIGYIDESNTYKISYLDNAFRLLVGDKLPSEYGAWKSLEYNLTKTYHSIDSFWDEFLKNKKWFLKFRPHQGISEKPLVLAKHIIYFFNNLRRNHSFTYEEYDKINEWQSSVWSEEYKRTELKQWCSNCYEEVYYQGRYPKCICINCMSKEISDKDGNLLNFSNLGFSGGFKIIRKNRDGQIIEEDNTKQFCDCIIDGKHFFAQEARFGGIVIQRKE